MTHVPSRSDGAGGPYREEARPPYIMVPDNAEVDVLTGKALARGALVWVVWGKGVNEKRPLLVHDVQKDRIIFRCPCSPACEVRYTYGMSMKGIHPSQKAPASPE